MKVLGYEASDSDIKRFESYIDKTDSGCWLWTGGKNIDGYGCFRLKSIIVKAHRVSYELYVDKIPKHLELDHLCRVEHCVNPKHLEAVTHRENCKRVYHTPRKECFKGHSYTSENTYYAKSGKRACKACHRVWAMNWYYKKKARKRA